MEYATTSCKFYEMDKKLKEYSDLGYKLHSFCALNQEFNEYMYMVFYK